MNAGTAQQSDTQALLAKLSGRFSNALVAVILYGSCLRRGNFREGLVDLYAVVDTYRKAYLSPGLAIANRMLPPNVFYETVDTESGPIRCKLSVISLRDFRRVTQAGCFESYFWGRFCQPVELLWVSDFETEQRVRSALRTAGTTLLKKCLPRLRANDLLTALWSQSLALSYSVELRSERSARGGEIVQHDRAHYRRLTREVLNQLPFSVTLRDVDGVTHCQTVIPSWRRLLARFSWPLRRVHGKLLSVLRLLKAFFTFTDGLDYLVWKLERHSGQKIELSPRARRWPLLFIWGDMLRLYRRGVFR